MKNINIALALGDAGANFVDGNGAFEWSAEQLSYNYDINHNDYLERENYKSISMHSCSNEEFSNKFPGLEASGHQLFLCIDDLTDIELFGGEGSLNGNLF